MNGTLLVLVSRRDAKFAEKNYEFSSFALSAPLREIL